MSSDVKVIARSVQYNNFREFLLKSPCVEFDVSKCCVCGGSPFVFVLSWRVSAGLRMNFNANVFCMECNEKRLIGVYKDSG